MMALKIIAVGSSEGVILNEEVKAKLGLQAGDTVCLTEAPGGGYRLARHPVSQILSPPLATPVDHLPVK